MEIWSWFIEEVYNERGFKEKNERIRW
jgi:hypothetical protein